MMAVQTFSEEKVVVMESALDIEQGLLFALLLLLPCQGQDLLPSSWSRSPQTHF